MASINFKDRGQRTLSLGHGNMTQNVTQISHLDLFYFISAFVLTVTKYVDRFLPHDLKIL